MDCLICCEKFTTMLRRKIACIYCNESVCLKCFCTYLLTEGNSQSCMICKEEISTEFIYLHTPKIFRQKYMMKITNLEMIKEKILLKATQEYINNEKQIKIIDKKITFIHKSINDLKTLTYKFDSLLGYIYKPPIDELQSLLKKSYEEFAFYENLCGQSDEDIQKTSKTLFCPKNKCKGLVTRGKCSECKITICCKCQEAKNEEHKCNEDVLETLALLKKDTKPCPKCKIPIYKIQGCDQMFCVECKTAFSWRTGNIQTGVIHNPHYFEWLRNTTNGNIPRQPGDDPCEIELDKALQQLFSIKSKFAKHNKKCKEIYDSNFVQRSLIEAGLIIQGLTRDIHGENADFRRKLRIKFLKDSNEKIWFVQIRLLYKKREMKKDLIRLIETFERGLKDAVVLAYRTQNYDVLLNTINSLISYVNSQLSENKQRHEIVNKTTISINNGLQCELIVY